MLRIGISACFFHADPQRAIFKGKTLQYVEQSIAHWVGSEPVLTYLIPSPAKHSPVTLKEIVADFDGLVLQGGSDVSPKTYGEKARKPEWEGDSIRDLYEISLLREFVAQGKPVLGVCRGAQLLNVAYGGTLHQDIASEIPAAINHRDWNIYDQNFHAVRLEPGLKLAGIYGARTVKTNTIHHQAIKNLGQGLKIEARCEKDGIIEAISVANEPFVVAVQWHPEFHDPKDSTLLDSTPLLREFLKHAQSAHSGGSK